MSQSRSEDLDESRQSLWLLTLAPGIWAAHFLLSYVTAAVWCAKRVGPGGPLTGARMVIAVATVVALAAIATIGRHGWQRHVFDGTPTRHDFDSPADRHRFLGFATVLLAGLSGLATLFTGLAVAFFEDCR